MPLQVKSEMKPTPVVLATCNGGRIFTTLVSDSSVYFYFEGHVELDMFEATIGPANAALKSGKATLYGDGANWKTYAGGYRDAWTKWFMSNRGRLGHTYLLIRSPILKMGVQVVNLFTGGSITSLSTSSDLYGKLRANVPAVLPQLSSWPPEIADRVRAGEPMKASGTR